MASPAELIVEHQKQLDETRPQLPKGIRALELLQMVYRGEYQATAQEMRAAIECLPYEVPKKPSSMSLTYDDSFAGRLEKAVLIAECRLIPAQQVIEHEDNSN